MMAFRIVLSILVVSWAFDADAQNLVVTNARIIDGTGRVIDRGSVVVQDGRIVSVAAGAVARVRGARVIDASGRTVVPGFIDAHRHVIRGDAAPWLASEAPARMQEFLESGFTTVVSAGDPPEAILELRRRLQAGEVRGPRVFAAGRASWEHWRRGRSPTWCS